MTLMAVQFINVESLFFLRKFIGPKNPLVSACFAYFVILRQSAKKMKKGATGTSGYVHHNDRPTGSIAEYLILRLEQCLGKAYPELLELYITWNKVQVCIPAMY